jgi:hypothetical protein
MTREELIDFLKTTKLAERKKPTKEKRGDEFLDAITEIDYMQLKETGHIRCSLRSVLYSLYMGYPDLPITDLKLIKSSKPPWIYYILRKEYRRWSEQA